MQWIFIHGKLIEKDLLIAFVLVYGPNDRSGRNIVWNELIELKQKIVDPMIILGDFNEILKPEERKGNSHTSASIRDFQCWLSNMGCVEPPLLSRKFTWYRNNSASCIDRVFVDIEWLEYFKNLKLWGLNRSVSDHCPLLISCENCDWGPKPFRSLDVWFSNPSFKKLVEKEWKGFVNLPLYAKLKKVNDPIKKWNKETFGDIDRKIEKLEGEIKLLDNLSDRQQLSEVEVARKKALTSQLWTWLKRKESYWVQMSRSKALREKDKNTKYFHLIATIRKSKKSLWKLKVGDRVLKNPRCIKKEVMVFFKTLYSDDNSVCLKIDGKGFPRLTQAQKDDLEIIHSVDEIKRVVWACESTKAPDYVVMMCLILVL